MKKNLYISFHHLIIGLSVLLIGCQTNQLGISNSKKYVENFRDIDNSLSSLDIKIKPPKYNSFTFNNARTNIKKAVISHPKFSRNLESIKIAKSNSKILKTNKETQINFQAISGLSRQDEKNEIGLTGTINIVKLLYDYGSTDLAIKAEEQKIQTAEFELLSQAEELALLAYQNWVNLSIQRQILSIYDTGINKAAPLVEKIDQISLSGIADSTMILKAKKEYSESIINMRKAEIVEKKAESNFKDIFNINQIDNLGVLKPKTIKSYSFHEKKMIANSSILKALKIKIKSLKMTKQSLLSQKKPNLTFRAGVNAPADNPLKNGSANVGILVNYIYDDGGKLNAEIESLQNQINYAEEDYKNYLKNLKLDLLVTYKSFIGARDTRNNLKELVTLSEKVRDNLNDQLSTGRAKLQDVLTAELNLSSNKILFLNTEREFLLNSYKINYLSGSLLSGVKWY